MGDALRVVRIDAEEIVTERVRLRCDIVLDAAEDEDVILDRDDLMTGAVEERISPHIQALDLRLWNLGVVRRYLHASRVFAFVRAVSELHPAARIEPQSKARPEQMIPLM